MKKADFVASLFAVLLGMISVCFGVLTDFGISITDGGIALIAALVAAYFAGSYHIFMWAISDEDMIKMAELEVVYGPPFWGRLAIGGLISFLLGILFYRYFKPNFTSATLVGLGFMSILTSFVTPTFVEGELIEDVDEFG